MSSELLSQLKAERRGLQAAVSGLTPADFDRPAAEGEPSARTLLGLLAEWEELVARGIDQAIRGEEPEALRLHEGEARQKWTDEASALQKDWPADRVQERSEKAWESLFEVLLDLPASRRTEPKVVALVESVLERYRQCRAILEKGKGGKNEPDAPPA